jgi:hypothetical protein
MMERIREHGMVCGYKFKITAFEANSSNSRVTVKNIGVAPIYYDTYVTVNSIRAAETLKYLQAGEIRKFTIQSGGANPKLTIECYHLVPGQRIEFEADLK